MDDLIIIKNRWWKRPLCWLRGGHTTSAYDYADNGWLFCHRCGIPCTVEHLNDQVHAWEVKHPGQNYFTRLIQGVYHAKEK